MYTKLKDRNAMTFQQLRLLTRVQIQKNKGLMRKKNFVLIAVIATTLASCSNDLFLDDNQDNQGYIGFTSFSEQSTRGDKTDKKNLEFYHNTFAVFGTKVNKKDASKIQYVFGGKATATTLNPAGVTCTYQETTPDEVLGDWKYTDPRFWDKQANYNFIAYAPVSDDNPISYYYSAANALVGADGNQFKTKAPYVLKATNLQATATEAEKITGFNVDGEDLDLMISAPNPQDGAAHSAEVNLVFRHILSKINVTVAKSQALQGCTVTVKDITISGLNNKGTYLESSYVNTSDSKVSGWTATKSDPYAYDLAYSDGQALNDGTIDNTKLPTAEGYFTPGNPFYFIESLVLPQKISAANQVILTMNYTIKSGSYTEEYPYELDLYDVVTLRDIYEGYNYTINFNIDPDVIKFDASVAAWSDETINKPI